MTVCAVYGQEQGSATPRPAGGDNEVLDREVRSHAGGVRTKDWYEASTGVIVVMFCDQGEFH